MSRLISQLHAERVARNDSVLFDFSDVADTWSAKRTAADHVDLFALHQKLSSSVRKYCSCDQSLSSWTRGREAALAVEASHFSPSLPDFVPLYLNACVQFRVTPPPSVLQKLNQVFPHLKSVRSVECVFAALQRMVSDSPIGGGRNATSLQLEDLQEILRGFVLNGGVASALPAAPSVDSLSFLVFTAAYYTVEDVAALQLRMQHEEILLGTAGRLSSLPQTFTYQCGTLLLHALTKLASSVLSLPPHERPEEQSKLHQKAADTALIYLATHALRLVDTARPSELVCMLHGLSCCTTVPRDVVEEHLRRLMHMVPSFTMLDCLALLISLVSLQPTISAPKLSAVTAERVKLLLSTDSVGALDALDLMWVLRHLGRLDDGITETLTSILLHNKADVLQSVSARQRLLELNDVLQPRTTNMQKV